MTNRPNDVVPSEDAVSEEPVTNDLSETNADVSAASEPEQSRHHFNDDDLRLAPSAPRESRHAIEKDEDDLPELVLTPRSSRKHRRKKEKKPKKQRTLGQKIRRVLLIILIVILVIALILTGTVMVLHYIGKQQMLNNDNVIMTAPQELIDNNSVVLSSDGRTVTYQNETYVFNENRTNILCVGIDKQALGTVDDVVGTGGQADAIFVLSIDTETGAIDVIAVPRDILVDVDVYNTAGQFVRSENTQICNSFAYGNGKGSSCKNTVKSASRLFYGIPINTYLAIDLSAIATLNDAVGGVQVTLPQDLRRNDGSIAAAGQTVTLVGAEAERFVRERDVELLDSNQTRMTRQKQFLEAFFSKAISATSKDIGVPLDLLDRVGNSCVTDLNTSRVTFLATTLVSNRKPLVFHTVPVAEIVEGEDGYAEYIADTTALYEQVLHVFYNKKK